jgi:hypothetical protein
MLFAENMELTLSDAYQAIHSLCAALRSYSDSCILHPCHAAAIGLASRSNSEITVQVWPP